MKSRPVSVNVTANGLAANQAQQTANQAQASAIKYKTAWEEANAENLAALSTAQSEFKSNLAWVKSQIHEGKHQNDSAVASLQSDMESSWGSMSTVEQSLYNSASTATSEVDSHLESLRAQNSQSLADLHNTANSLHAAATSLHADADAMRSSLTAATSELGKDITTTRNSLDGVRNSLRTASSELGDNLAGARNSLAAVDSSLRTATSEVGNNLNSVKNSLAAVDADLRNGIKQANNDLSATKTSLTATGNSLANRAGSLATATSELQRQTGQLSGSLSTADSMIMFNSNAIAEVKRTAGEISTTVSNIRVGGRNLLTNTRTLSDVWNGTTETVDGFTVAKATNTRTDGGNYDIIAWNGLKNIKSNTDYVLTFYAKASKATGIYSYLYNIGPGYTVSTGYMDGSTRNTLTTDYQRYTVHFHTATMSAGRTVNCLPVRLIEGGVTAWVYGVQLEEGNTATQWQPNPADTDQAISKVSQTADAIRADLTNTKGDVASVKATANSLQSQITDNKNNISSVKQTAAGLQTTVQSQSGKISQLQQDADGLKLTATGGGNLLDNTSDTLQKFSGKSWSYYPSSSDEPVAKHQVDGKTVTLSAWIENPSKEAWVQMYTDKGKFQGNKIPAGGKGWSQVTYTMPSGFSGWNIVVGCGDGSGEVTLSYSSLQLELGPNRTAWSQSTADIAQLKVTAGKIQTQVNDNKGSISSLQQTATALQSSLSNTQGEVSNVKQTASKLQSDLSNAKGDISSLQQTASGLTSRVGNAEGSISQLQQTANGLTSTVSNMKSGGANMLPAGKLTSFYSSTVTYDAGSDTYTIVNPATANAPWGSGVALPGKVIEVPWGQTACISMQVYTPTAGEMAVDINNSGDGVAHGNDNDNRNKSVLHNSNVPANEWTTFWFTYENSSVSGNPKKASLWDAHTGIGLKLNNVTWKIRHPMVQIGTFPSEWSPSPKDTDSAISQIKQTADQIKADVADNKGNISSVTQTANAVKTDLANTKGDVASVKAKADSLTTQLADAKGNISRLQQTASGLTSRVGNAEGSISQLQQTANGLTSTVSNMKSGGANMLPAGKLTSFYSSTVTYDAGSDTYTIVNPATANAPWGSGVALPGKVIEVPWGQTACISMQVYTPTAGEMAVDINNSGDGVAHGNDNDNRNKSVLHNSNVPANEWTTFWFTYENSSVSGNPKKASLWDAHTGIGLKLNNVTWKIRHPMVQIGTFPSEWSPSPKDTDSAISQIKQTADQIKADVADNKGNISSVTQTANAVKTDLANTKGDVASVKAKADSLTTQLADAKGNISRLQQTATGLQSTVQSQSGKISQLQQDTKGLTATVADGGQNLILNSGNPSTLDHWRWKGEVTLQKHPFWKNGTENLFVLWNTSSTDEKFFSNERFAIEPNQDYTLSFYAFNNSALKNADVWYLPRKSSSSNDYDTAINLASVVKFSTDNAQYIRLTFNSGDYDEGYIRFDNNSSTTEGTWAGLYLADIQLEKGKIATAWSNSPGDIAQLKITADGLTSKVADTQGNVSKLQQTASSLQTQITNNKNDVASVKVTADSVKTDLTNAKNDIASVKLKADSLTSSMTNANKQISTLQQRADSITTTLSQGGNNLLNNSQGNFQPKNSAIDNWTRYGGVNVYMTQGRKYTVSAQSAPGFAFGSTHNTTTESNRILLWLVDNNVYQVISSNTTDISQGGTHFTWNHPSGIYTLRVNSYKKDNSGYAYHVQIECGDNATPWQPSNGDISSLQQTASQLTSDMKDAKGNISSLQQTAGGLTSDVRDAKGNISSLQQKATELDGQIKAVDGRATTTKATADGISARVSKIEGNQTVGSLLKLTGNEAGLGSYVNGKLIAGINTNTNGNVTIDGKQIHLTHYTQIDDGCINASKITVHNSVGNDNGEAKDQYLAAAWGQLNSTIGKTTDNGKTSLWGSINQTAEKFSSYYTRADVDNKLSQQSSLISQTANNITALVNDAKNFTTFTVSSTNKWDFNNTKSAYGNWFLNGDTSSNYVYNGPSYTWGQKLAPCMYVTSRGPKDGSRFVVTVWKDNDPTQYQRVWNGSWSDWVMLPNSQNLISAINLSPDSVKISGKNIELNGNTKVTGRLDLMQDSARSVSQSTNYHNNWVWNNAHIYFDNYLQLLGENCNVHYTNTNTTLNGGKTFYSITTLTPGYLKFTTYNHKVNDTDENFDGQITRSYLDSGRLETPEVYTDKFVITGHHIRVRDNQFLMLTNKKGTNFDNNGSVGFQVWGGIVLGQNTIGAPSNELYFQRGNIDAILGQSYSDAPKLTLHAQKVVSQEANSVSSRLSVKTSITKVTYDRALMAVQNTDMYDYRYIADNSGQHYVSGIIDDVHDKPEYNMDPMLINQERTARIDANLLGYHHVVLQEILKRLDKLEAK